MLVFYFLLSTNILGIALGEFFVAETDDNTFYLADLDADSAALLVGAEGNAAPAANDEDELIQQLGEYLDAAEGVEAESAGAESAGAEGAGAEDVGVEGAGADSVGTEGAGAEGVGAEGAGADSVGAEGTGAEDVGAEGAGAVSEGAEAVGAEGTGAEGEEVGNDYSAAAAGGSNRKKSKNCIATGGPGKGKPCIFPFHWVKTGKTYTECTTDGGAEFWCSTKIDELGDHLSGNWGECPAHCLKDADKTLLETTGVRKSCQGEEATCIFPLTLGGYSYRGCVDSPSHNHGKCVGRNSETGKAMETGCTKNCPRDLLLTNLDHTMAHILKALMQKPIITNKIKRVPLMTKKASCQNMLRKKFSQSDKKLHPKQLQAAKSWDEAFKMACETSSYCLNSKSPACKSSKITLRKTQVKDKSDADIEYKADCKISCGFPDDPTSDYNNLVH